MATLEEELEVIQASINSTNERIDLLERSPSVQDLADVVKYIENKLEESERARAEDRERYIILERKFDAMVQIQGAQQQKLDNIYRGETSGLSDDSKYNLLHNLVKDLEVTVQKYKKEYSLSEEKICNGMRLNHGHFTEIISGLTKKITDLEQKNSSDIDLYNRHFTDITSDLAKKITDLEQKHTTQIANHEDVIKTISLNHAYFSVITTDLEQKHTIQFANHENTIKSMFIAHKEMINSFDAFGVRITGNINNINEALKNIQIKAAEQDKKLNGGIVITSLSSSQTDKLDKFTLNYQECVESVSKLSKMFQGMVQLQSDLQKRFNEFETRQSTTS